MKKNNTATTSGTISITEDAKAIVCTEIKITLSDERLRRLLSEIYEKACSNCRRRKYDIYYSSFFSVAFTLLLTVLTSDFKCIFGVSGVVLTRAVWILIAFLVVVGIITMITETKTLKDNENTERKEAVDKALSDLSM